MSNKLKIFGVPMSQAVRTVLWMMLYKKLPFELIITAPGSPKENGTRHPSYLEKYPNGTIPGIEDSETGYLLSESIAIMCYLCNKHKWDDLYPQDPELRGKVDHYLHYHHRSVKEASVGYFAPILRPDLGLSKDVINMSQRSFKNALKALDSQWLAKNNFIAGENVTVADFSAYVEIAQLNKQFTNLFDYSSYTNLSRWLDAMSKLPFHDDVHMVLTKMGDISQSVPAMDVILKANIETLAHVNEIAE
jgi:glutathione S-transferase